MGPSENYNPTYEEPRTMPGRIRLPTKYSLLGRDTCSVKGCITSDATLGHLQVRPAGPQFDPQHHKCSVVPQTRDPSTGSWRLKVVLS